MATLSSMSRMAGRAHSSDCAEDSEDEDVRLCDRSVTLCRRALNLACVMVEPVDDDDVLSAIDAVEVLERRPEKLENIEDARD